MELVMPGIGLVFWMLLSFTIVFLLLRKFAWKAILKMLRDREENIKNALESAEKAKEQMTALQADNERILSEARKERDQLMKEAREIREKMIQDAKAQAAGEADKLIQTARLGIQNEKAAAMSDLRNQIADLSVEIAEKLLARELSNESKQKEYLEGLVKDIKLN